MLSRNASHEINCGFESPLREQIPDAFANSSHPLEDVRHAQVRRLLYECYHAVTAIVREYCRRSNDSDDREMPARKRLTQALRALDNMDDFGREKQSNPDGRAFSIERPKPNHG